MCQPEHFRDEFYTHYKVISMTTINSTSVDDGNVSVMEVDVAAYLPMSDALE